MLRQLVVEEGILASDELVWFVGKSKGECELLVLGRSDSLAVLDLSEFEGVRYESEA